MSSFPIDTGTDGQGAGEKRRKAPRLSHSRRSSHGETDQKSIAAAGYTRDPAGRHRDDRVDADGFHGDGL